MSTITHTGSGSSEFQYTLDEARIAWDGYCRHFSVVFEVLQWAKRDGLLDEYYAVEAMYSALKEMVEISEQESTSDFDTIMKVRQGKWMCNAVHRTPMPPMKAI